MCVKCVDGRMYYKFEPSDTQQSLAERLWLKSYFLIELALNT